MDSDHPHMITGPTDHTGPHGRCAVDTPDPDCTCPDVHYSATRGWYCTCCDGDAAFGDLEAADLLIYSIWRRRVRAAIYRFDTSPMTLIRAGRRPADS